MARKTAISLKDVAELSGVSTATVSHVINGTRNVSGETRERVNAAMASLGYQRNYLARAMRRQRSNAIGCIIPDISNFFFGEIVEGAESVLKEKGYSIFLSNTGGSIRQEEEQIQTFASWMVDGIILASSDPDLDTRSVPSCPVVCVDREPANNCLDYVGVNGREVTCRAIQEMAERGYQKIGYITGSYELSTTQERLKGYHEALRSRGIPFRSEYVKIGNSKMSGGQNLMRELVETTDVQAVFVANNLMTIGALQTLKEMEIPIPERIALFGFDDSYWTNALDPPLSTIRQPGKEIGCEAARLLLERMEGGEFAPRRIILDAKICMRRSI